jgi:hypothetical protein
MVLRELVKSSLHFIEAIPGWQFAGRFPCSLKRKKMKQALKKISRRETFTILGSSIPLQPSSGCPGNYRVRKKPRGGSRGAMTRNHSGGQPEKTGVL